MSLSYEERKVDILATLDRTERVQVQSLADQLQVSTETIRRDLDRLEKEGKLKKVYGGAIKARMEAWEAPFVQRTNMLAAEKRAIGRYASSLIGQGETIMVDNGTTTIELIRHLQDRPDVTMITHSIPVMLLALELFRGKIIFAGGEIDGRSQTASGTLTEQMLQQFTVHKAFISVGGVSLVEGTTDYELNEASLSQRMMERAEEAIVLADHTKFGKTTFARIAPLEEVSRIITDEGCSPEWIRQISELGVQVIVAAENGRSGQG